MKWNGFRLFALMALLLAAALLYVFVSGMTTSEVRAPAREGSERTASSNTWLGQRSTNGRHQKSAPEPKNELTKQESDLVGALEAFVLSDPETKKRYEEGVPLSSVPADLQDKLKSLPPSAQKVFELASYLPNRPIESLTPAMNPPQSPEPTDAASLVKQLTAFVESDPETAIRMAENRPVSRLDPELQEKLATLPPDIQRLFEIAQYLPNRSLTPSARQSTEE